MAFNLIFRGYEQSPLLRDYTTRVSDKREGIEHDINRVKEVYQSLFQKTDQYSLATPTHLSVTEMEKVARNIKKIEADTLFKFFESATKQLKEAQQFLNSLKDLSDEDKVREIKEWLEAHHVLLKTIEAMRLVELDFLPEEITYFKNLNDLSLRYCEMSTLPDFVGNLPHLRELSLSYTKLKCLPETLGNLQALESLDLFCNKLESLPSSMVTLKKLNFIDIRGNEFTAIPKVLDYLKLTNPDLLLYE